MKKKSIKIIMKRIMFVVLGLIVIGAVSFSALLIYANSFADTSFMSDVNNFKLKFSTVIYGFDKTKNDYVEVEFLHGGENRIWVDYKDVPKNLTNAFIAIEDKRFYDHKGVDWGRTISATLNFFTNNDRYGGSTITQQFIKNITGDNKSSPDRKLREIVRAIQLEKKLSKEDIMELYINTFYTGFNYYGVQSASNGYFGKDVSELNLAECASLAGITNLPAKYNPLSSPEDNKKRQEIILSEMLAQEMISQQEYEDAVNYTLVINKNINAATSTSKQSYFADQLITNIIKDLQSKGYSEQGATNLIYSGGLKIYSTMDPAVQKSVTDVFSNTANFPTLSGSMQPEAAIVVLNPSNSDVVAMYGGRGPKTADRTLNRAMQIKRSPGSTIKPISVYAPALENGIITSGDIYEDSPFNKETSWPKNYYTGYRGPVTLQYAIEQSINTIAVKVLDQLTPQKSFDFLQDKLHVSSLVRMSNGKTDIDYSPLALGGLTNGISVLELAAAYVPFDNNGIYNTPRIYTKVLDSSGNVLLEAKKESSVAMSEETAFITTKLLQNVVLKGTGTPAALKGRAQPVAAKTGTTDNDTDRWFVGYTPYYVSAVWFGYDSPKTVSGVSVNPALSLWKLAMERIHSTLPNKAFPSQHSNVVAAQYCTASGGTPGPFCPSETIGTAWYKNGTQPQEPCDFHLTDPHHNFDADPDETQPDPSNGNPYDEDDNNNNSSKPPEWLLQ